MFVYDYVKKRTIFIPNIDMRAYVTQYKELRKMISEEIVKIC